MTRRRRRSLTRPDPTARVVPDLIGRDFTAPLPGIRLVGDINCLRTAEGWLYVSAIIGVCSRRVHPSHIDPYLARRCEQNATPSDGVLFVLHSLGAWGTLSGSANYREMFSQLRRYLWKIAAGCGTPAPRCRSSDRRQVNAGYCAS